VVLDGRPLARNAIPGEVHVPVEAQQPCNQPTSIKVQNLVVVFILPNNKTNKRPAPAKRAQRTVGKDPRQIMRKRKVRTTNFQLAPMTSGSQTGTKNSIRSRMPRRLGSTLEGSMWALRALHPCDDSTGGGLPIPDLSQTNSANCETRHLTILSAPADLPNGELWDLQVVILPFSDAVCAYRKRQTSSLDPAWSYWHMVDLTNGTIKPGHNTFSNITFPFGVNSLPTLNKDASAFRQSFKGLTIEMDASALFDQGMVTSGQWGTQADVEEFKSVFNQALFPNLVDFSPMKHVLLKGIPRNKTDVLGACPNAGDWPAKHGVYMPMRFTQNTHDYKEATGTEVQNTSVDPSTTLTSGMPILLYDVNSADNPGTVQYPANLIWDSLNSYGPQGSYYTTAGDINQNLGTCIFSGLHSSAKLSLKTRTGLEFVAVADTTMAAFMSQAPLKDDVALNLVQATQTRLPVVYYAKYNSLGMLLPLIGKAAATILPTLLPHLLDWMSPPKASPPSVNLPALPRKARRYIEEDLD